MEELNFWRSVVVKQDQIDEVDSSIRVEELKDIKTKEDTVAKKDEGAVEDEVDQKVA